MVQYKIASAEPLSRWVEIEIKVPTKGRKHITFQLPSWRPGRYELGNFAKNVSKFEVKGQNGSLSFGKITKDKWQVKSDDSNEITVSYRYYAADLNAGSTYTCPEFLYVNPVNCLMYDSITADNTLQISVPQNFELAIGKSFTKNNSGFEVSFTDFHELADSPFIAGTSLQKQSYDSGGATFHVWLNGECKPDWKKIITDFKKFTDRQIQSFGKFTSSEYHFLIHATPFPFYHGVEHLTTSVNALGPGYALMEERYEDLLGLCSHELYHSWNIKSIRPVEMHPYRYDEENYFRTGFVAEGVTTYMGDLMLYASGVFDDAQFFKELSQQLQKHMDNGGRMNYSVADSGFDTWLDGYVPGVPDRKVSIYTEGCLIALMCDVLILENTKGKSNLDDVMRELYNDFASNNKGYTSEEYQSLVEKYAGRKLPEIFNDLVYGTKSYLPLLETCLEKLGLHMLKNPNSVFCERVFGFKVTETPDKSIVTAITTNSPSYGKLALNDQILAVNKMTVRGDLNRWLNYFGTEKITLTVSRSGVISEVTLKSDGNTYNDLYFISSNEKYPTQLAKAWKERN